MVELVGISGAAPGADPPPTAATSTDPADESTIAIEAGNQRFLNNSTYSATLSLQGAVDAGLLELGQAADISSQVQGAATGGNTNDVGDSTGSGGSADGALEAATSGECAWRAAEIPSGDSAWGNNNPAEGRLMVNICNGPTTYMYVPNPPAAAGAAAAPAPPPAPDPVVLAQQAYGELSLPAPTAFRSPSATNSDPDHGGLPFTIVGLRTWFWVAGWQPVQRTVELQGVSVTLTATPVDVRFDPGNGDGTVGCPGPGRAWTPADGNEAPTNGGCAYTYTRVSPDGPLTATTSVDWQVVWTSNTGAGGSFPDGVSQVSDPLLVEQIQVVVR